MVMQVKLLHATPLWVCSKAIRTCWDSHDKSDSSNGQCGSKDLELIERVGNKNKHKSVLEHIVFSFDITDITRGVLQELARHRMASLSVKSTRYTLKKHLVEEAPFHPVAMDTMGEVLTRAARYIQLDSSADIIDRQLKQLEILREVVRYGGSNDELKGLIPESFLTSLVWTINARSLQNFLALRTSKSAWYQIRELAQRVYNALPNEYHYLFEDSIAKD